MGVKIHRLDKCLAKIGDIRNIDMSEPMSKGALTIVRRARDLVPVDTSQLMQSIWYEPRDNSFNNGVVIFANAEYASYVEFGTSRPHFVPFVTRDGKETGLRGWASRKGMDTSKMKGLVVSGKPQPFLLPAFNQEKKRAEELIVKYAQIELNKIAKK